MKFIINTKNLKKVLNVVGKISGKNLNLPILSTLLLKTENKRLKISSTNLEVGINYWLGSIIQEEGEIAVPVKILSDFVSGIDDEKINISVKKNTVNINSENYKTQIIGFETKDFPLIPKIDSKIISVNSKILLNSLVSVIDSVSLSAIRPELTGILFKFNGPKLYLASTDSFRLSERVIPIQNEKSISVIVPRNTILEVIKLLSDMEGDINIFISDNQIQFSGSNFDLISRLIDGRYPDYHKIIPDKFISKAIYNKSELEKNIKLTGLFASNINDIKLNIGKDISNLLAKHTDKGEMVSKIKNQLINEPFDISLNYLYLLDGLKNINSEKVIIEYTGDGNPLILKPDDKDIRYTYLIMPLKN